MEVVLAKNSCSEVVPPPLNGHFEMITDSSATECVLRDDDSDLL